MRDGDGLRELVRLIHHEHLATPVPFETILSRAGALDAERVAIMIETDLVLLSEHDHAVRSDRYECLPRELRTSEVEAMIDAVAGSRGDAPEAAAADEATTTGTFGQSVGLLRSAFMRDVRLPFLALVVVLVTGSLIWWWGYQQGAQASRNETFSTRMHQRLMEVQDAPVTPSDPDSPDTGQR